MISSSINKMAPIGWWMPDRQPPQSDLAALTIAIRQIAKPLVLVKINDSMGVGSNGTIVIGGEKPSTNECFPLIAYAPPLPPHLLGDPLFKKKHHLRYAYIVGAMANGITSTDMVESAGRNGMVGFFGSAGLSLSEVENAIGSLQHRLKGLPYGFNFIHSPNEPDFEMALANLYLTHRVKLVSASAFLTMTLPLVYYRIKGMKRSHTGEIICPNRIIAKVSRIEVAEKFLSPPPEKFINQLVTQKLITPEEASIAHLVPMADDLTAEADSGGHTDNQPALALLPTMLALRDRMVEKYNYQSLPCVGLAGGIATPDSAAAAFAMGASFILTGSINQSCIEAGTSDRVRQLLAQAKQGDVTMAPAADMFEMGIKVQVLKRGTMFAVRAAKLYELYRTYNRFEDIPDTEQRTVEQKFFQNSFEETWRATKDFFLKRDPSQIQRAESNPRHKMALVFRSYLGRSSNWAISGDPQRQMDYQIWCGPAMGAFNEWVQGTFLDKPENRRTVTIALNLLVGASVLTRTHWIRNQGVQLPYKAVNYYPLDTEELTTISDHIIQ